MPQVADALSCVQRGLEMKDPRGRKDLTMHDAEGEAARVRAPSSLGLTGYSQVDMLGWRDEFVDFGEEKSPGSPTFEN